MTDLHYGDPSGHDDIYNMDDSDDIYVMTDCPVSQTAPTNSVQSGYQDRRALRGISRGYRSESSYSRRRSSRKIKQQEARRDFRQWKSGCKDSSLWTHGDQNPNPLICPKPAARRRLYGSGPADRIFFWDFFWEISQKVRPAQIEILKFQRCRQKFFTPQSPAQIEIFDSNECR